MRWIWPACAFTTSVCHAPPPFWSQIFRDPSFASKHGSGVGSKGAPPLPREQSDIYTVDEGAAPVGAVRCHAAAEWRVDSRSLAAPHARHTVDPQHACVW